MKKVTYGRLLLNEFSNMKESYDCLGYINFLESNRIEMLKSSSEEDIKKFRLYKEHYLVRFFKQMSLEIMDIQNKLYVEQSSNMLSIDSVEVGNTPKYKNDLMSLRIFISKLEQFGYRKIDKVS